MTMVNVHDSCHYALLCYTLQGAILVLSFLAKPCQPNKHDDQMVLVDPLEGDKLDTPTTHGYLWYGLNHGPAHNHGHDYNHGPDSHGLGSLDSDLGTWHFMHVGCSSTT